MCSLQDNGGLTDTATVLINVVDFDNLNPYFSHSVYRAFILENQVSLPLTGERLGFHNTNKHIFSIDVLKKSTQSVSGWMSKYDIWAHEINFFFILKVFF